jgi:hypothetical protein
VLTDLKMNAERDKPPVGNAVACQALWHCANQESSSAVRGSFLFYNFTVTVGPALRLQKKQPLWGNHLPCEIIRNANPAGSYIAHELPV